LIEFYAALVRELFRPWQPDELIVRAQVKPGFLKGDDAITCSIALDFKHSQQSLGQIYSLAYLRV
jgi:hypothetical protein